MSVDSATADLVFWEYTLKPFPGSEMHRFLVAIALAVFVPSAGFAQPTCTDETRKALHSAAIQARFEASFPIEGAQPTLSAQEVVDLGNASLQTCGQDRVTYGLIMALMFGASGTMSDPGERQGLLASAFRTAGSIAAAGGHGFEDVVLATSEPWTVAWEREIYGHLMLALAKENRDTGLFMELYTEGQMEQLGCGLYPDSEVSAYADEIMMGIYEHDEIDDRVYTRVSFLGIRCDDDERRVSGMAARYFADIALNEAYDTTPEDEASALFQRAYRAARSYLLKHLDGATESDLWRADDAATFLPD